MWGLLNDLWRYHPATSEWTWISGSQNAYGLSVYGPLGVATASAVPGARDKGVTFTDSADGLWIFDGFGDQPDGQSRGGLAEMGKFSIASGEWILVSGNATVDAPSVYGTLGVASASNTPGGRIFDVVWQTAPAEVVMYGGKNYEGYLSDPWKYSTATGVWTCETLGAPALAIVPGRDPTQPPGQTPRAGCRFSGAGVMVVPATWDI